MVGKRQTGQIYQSRGQTTLTRPSKSSTGGYYQPSSFPRKNSCLASSSTQVPPPSRSAPPCQHHRTSKHTWRMQPNNVLMATLRQYDMPWTEKRDSTEGCWDLEKGR